LHAKKVSSIVTPMKPRRAPLASALVAAALLVQACVPYYPVAVYQPLSPPQYAVDPPGAPAPTGDAGIEAARLDQLLGPIALYPDPLIALVLAASTAPADIAAASAYLIQYGDVTRIDSQPWDPSVRSLAHYPAVIAWMAENIAWTRALGAAFIASPADVTASIQRLRGRALAAGALAPTPQQRVLTENGAIEILPAEADSIYVPVYDDAVVYSNEPYYGYGGPFIDFGAPCAVGPWLSFCLDWLGGGVWIGDWGAWRGPGGWHHPHFGGGRPQPGVRPWHPGALPAGPPALSPARGYPAPRPLIGAPNPPPARFKIPPAQAHPQERGQGSPQPGPRTPAPAAERSVSGTPPGFSYVYVARPAEAEPVRAPAQGEQRAYGGVPAGHSEPSHGAATASGQNPAPSATQSTDQKNH